MPHCLAIQLHFLGKCAFPLLKAATQTSPPFLKLSIPLLRRGSEMNLRLHPKPGIYATPIVCLFVCFFTMQCLSVFSPLEMEEISHVSLRSSLPTSIVIPTYTCPFLSLLFLVDPRFFYQEKLLLLLLVDYRFFYQLGHSHWVTSMF